jgi:hypothetical protein
MQQRADRSRSDAADPSTATSSRLAVGDDRERLERRRGEADGVGPDVPGDERAALGRGRELDPVTVDEEADAAGP